jgi:hypothetical protein
MEEYLTRVWDQLIGRVHGPLTFRLLVQPTVVAVLAILGAVKDARDGRPQLQESIGFPTLGSRRIFSEERTMRNN